MELNLTDKVAVVTGASKGIGLAVTRALVAEGARVVAGSRTITDELVSMADTGQVMAVAVDLSTPGAAADLVARATHFGGLDIVVNNVGAVTPRTAGFLAVTDEDWLATLNLNLMATVRTTRAAIPYLLERGIGNVVTVASVNAFPA
jgi:NAD(P)-dependent dehydrogenase (short-subunit alcohol dehydrogenase family)